MNTGEPCFPDPVTAGQRVQRMQAKLHLWAAGDPGRRFDDLFNLIYHPDFLAVAWERVRGNKGARTPGVDRVIPAFISGDPADVTAFLNEARGRPEGPHVHPGAGPGAHDPQGRAPGKFRRLGIPTEPANRPFAQGS